MLRCSIRDDAGEAAGFQRFLHGPEQGNLLFQGQSQQFCARQAQLFGTMTIEFSVLPAFDSGSTPQDWPLLPVHPQAQDGQPQGKAHGGGIVAIFDGGDIMQAVAAQALFGQMSVNGAQAEVPRHGRTGAPILPAAALLQLVAAVFDAGDMIPQAGHKGAGLKLFFRGNLQGRFRCRGGSMNRLAAPARPFTG